MIKNYPFHNRKAQTSPKALGCKVGIKNLSGILRGNTFARVLHLDSAIAGIAFSDNIRPENNITAAGHRVYPICNKIRENLPYLPRIKGKRYRRAYLLAVYRDIFPPVAVSRRRLKNQILQVDRLGLGRGQAGEIAELR
jgi:hypothetical protein